MTDGLPRDYSHSRAVLIGVWDYVHLRPVPATRNSLERMAQMLTGPLCGWPQQRVEVLRNAPPPDNLPDRLMELYEGVSDIALFYFVGHGQLHGEQLCLALRESPEAGPRRRTMGLPYDEVRAALRECDARTKIVILDCCFSGIATLPNNTLAANSNVIMDFTAGAGAFIMAASAAYRTAWHEEDGPTSRAPSPQTYFTKYLIDTIEQATDSSNGLPLGDIFARTSDALMRDNLPKPTRSNRHDADRFILAPGSWKTVATVTQRITERARPEWDLKDWGERHPKSHVPALDPVQALESKTPSWPERLRELPERVALPAQQAVRKDKRHSRGRRLNGTAIFVGFVLLWGCGLFIIAALHDFGANEPVPRGLAPKVTLTSLMSLYVPSSEHLTGYLPSQDATESLPPGWAVDGTSLILKRSTTLEAHGVGGTHVLPAQITGEILIAPWSDCVDSDTVLDITVTETVASGSEVYTRSITPSAPLVLPRGVPPVIGSTAIQVDIDQAAGVKCDSVVLWSKPGLDAIS